MDWNLILIGFLVVVVAYDILHPASKSLKKE